MTGLIERTLYIVEKFLPSAYRPVVAEKLGEFFRKITAKNSSGTSARAALLVFGVRLFSAAIAFALQVLLARWMGSAQYGAFVLAWVTILFVGHLSCLGLQTAIIRFITEYRSRHDKAHLRGILISAPLVSVLISLILALFGFSLIGWLSDSINSIYVIPFYLSLICLPMIAIEEIQDGIARSFDLPLIAFGPIFIVRPMVILIIMAIAHFNGVTTIAPLAILSAIIATLISTALQSLLLLRQVKILVADEFDDSVNDQPAQNTATRKQQRTSFQPAYWFSVAVPVFFAGGFYNLQTNIDVMFIGYFLDPKNVAVYFAAIKTLALVHFVHFATRAASAHHFSRYHSNNDMRGLENYMQKITQWTFWPTLALAITMVLAGSFILDLFGAEFEGGQPLLTILAVGIVARSLMGPAESLLSMTGHQNASVLVLAATLVSNIILNFVLIPLFGVAGAAIATTSAMIIESVALHIAISRRLGISVPASGFLNPSLKGIDA